MYRKVRIICTVVLQKNGGYNTYCRIEKNHTCLIYNPTVYVTVTIKGEKVLGRKKNSKVLNICCVCRVLDTYM